MGTNDQIMQGGSYWLRGIKSLVKLVFPLIDLSLGYWYIFFEKLTSQIGDWILKTHFAHFVSGAGDFM